MKTLRARIRRLSLSAALLLAGILFVTAVCTAPVPAQASGRTAYTYTIRIYSGQQGTINGSDVIVYSGLQYGERFSFNQKLVKLNDDSKYYIKGIRESGKEQIASFIVEGDQDYVVNYGLLNDAVAYTIHYVDAAGNALAPSETYYGNVGDKPVIAYQYMENYQPQAYNLTKTLTANAAENVFTFVYTPVPAGGTPGGTTPGGADADGGAAGGGAEAGGGEGGGADADGGAEAGGGAPDGADADGGAADGGAPDGADDNLVDVGDNDVPLTEPDDIFDIDENAPVPLASGEEDGNGKNKEIAIVADAMMLFRTIPLAGRITAAIILAAATGVGLWFLVFYKKRKTQK